MNEAGGHDFEFHYLVTDSDFHDLAIAAAGKFKNFQVGAALVAIVAGVASLVANLDSFWGTYLILLGVGLIVLSARPLVLWLVRRQARGTLGTTADVVIDADGVSLPVSGAISKVPWTSLTKGENKRPSRRADAQRCQARMVHGS